MASSKRAKGYIIGPYDSASNWETSTRTLFQGEKVYARVNNGDVRSKTGDGSKTFRELPYDDEALYESLGKKAANDLSNVSDQDFQTKLTRAGGVTNTSRSIDVTLSAAGWAEGRQTIQVGDISKFQNGSIGPANTITPEEFSAVLEAGLYLCGQTEDTITIAVSGAVPTCDIPACIILVP